MSFFKLAVPALALAGAALAQESSSCSAATATISASADAMSVAACPTFTGSVAIATDFPGDLSLQGQLREIDGSLIASNSASLTSITADQLSTIKQDFTLTNLTQLSAVTFSRLNQIGGAMTWQSLPVLYGLTFPMGVQRISQVVIQDTQILDLSGINLKQADSVDISNNNRLNTLSWQLSSVTSTLNIADNGPSNGFNATFGNLASAGSISITRVNSLTMNSLKNLTGTLNLYNTSAEAFQFPNLTMSGTISLQDNDNLNNISFPVLNRIKSGGLRIQRNPALTDDITFPSLNRIDGDLTCSGAFSELLFPEIQTIQGAVKVQSSGSLSQTCSNINGYQKAGIIGVKPTCTSDDKDNSVTGAGGNNGGSNGGTTTSEAAAANVVIPGVVTLGSLLAAVFGLL